MQNVRCGSDAAIAISARRCMGDGIVFYRPTNDVILSEGIGGVIGSQYFRFIRRLHRDPERKRAIVWHREGWVSSPDVSGERGHPPTAFTRTNAEEEVETDTPTNADANMQTPSPTSGIDADIPCTPALANIAGINPFSSAGSESA